MLIYNPFVAIKKTSNSWVIIALIAIFVLLIRTWSLASLATFGGDLGYDLAEIKKIIGGNLTLLGSPIARTGGTFLYLGPLYYYLQVPFLLLTKLDPFGAAIPIILTWPITTIFVYLINKNLFSKEAGIFASLIAALSPYFINRLGPPSQPYLIIPLTSALVYLTLKAKEKNHKIFLICGFLAGLTANLHYLALITFPATILFAVYAFKSSRIKNVIFIIVGFTTAISPIILFELRNEFFLTHQIFKQASAGSFSSSTVSITTKLIDSLNFISTDILGIHTPSLLLFILMLASIFLALKNVKAQNKRILTFLVSLLVLNFLGVIFYSGGANPHYLAVSYPIIFILLGAVIYFSKKVHKSLPYVLMIFLSVSLFKANNFFQETGYTMPQGMNLSQIRKVSRIIALDAPIDKPFNIASTLDGDTRSMSYRYLVEVYGKTPQNVERYPESQVIYLVSRHDEEEIKRYTVWEISSFHPFDFANSWEITNGIHLYKLVKSNL